MPDKSRTLAAIDLGTNSFHMVIVQTDKGGAFRILDREKIVVRLGSGSGDMKYLSNEALERGIAALKRFRELAESRHATIRAVATSAVREALNRDVFIRRVRVETGIAIEIASGPEEARLIHLGVSRSVPMEKKTALTIDIGGGSTEFVVSREDQILFADSIKMGAIRYTQRFFSGEKTNLRSVRECRAHVAGLLNPVKRELEEFDIEMVVGSSGTIMNLASIICAQKGETDLRINNTQFTAKELRKAVAVIVAAKDARTRLKIRGLDPQRADIIVAGALILEQIFMELGIGTMVVSEFALREGIILDTIQKTMPDGRSPHLSHVRLSSVLQLGESLRYEKSHVQHVARLALQIFDQTAHLHKFGKQERDYLEAAALLHDVGSFISHSQHHRHSYYIIRNAGLLGFTENDKEIVANIARYHRKSHPKPKHEQFQALSAEDQRRVSVLAGILRVADGFDRTHMSRIRSVRCAATRSKLNLAVIPKATATIDMELWGAEQKKQLLEETLNRTVTIKTA